MIGRAHPGLTLKLAWRQLLRAKGSSVLVAALIAVPVAGASGALTFMESRTPSPEQSVTLELGQTQSWVAISGAPDSTRRQAVDMPWMTRTEDPADGGPVHAQKNAPTDLSDAPLPAGTEAIELSESHARMSTRDGIAGFPVIYGDSWDKRLKGKYQTLSGRTPQNADEGMATPGLLKRLGVHLGGDIELADQHRTVHIVGVLQARDGNHGEVLFRPATAMDESAAADGTRSTWYLPDWQPNLEQLSGLNHAGYISYARALVQDPPAGADTSQSLGASDSKWVTLAIVSIGLVFGGLLVGLLAAAAMAVSARRQQRSLAVVTTIGARRSDVFRLVLSQGGLLGLVGGIVGSALAIAVVAIIYAVLDPGVENLFWSSWGLKVPWSVAGVVAFALLVGLASSALPARSATRGDAIAALRGARRPVVMSRRQPVWGIIILVAGAGIVMTGGAIFAFAGAQQIWDSGLQTLALWSSIIGVLILLLGVTVTGQGVLAAMARGLANCGAAARLASRDAFANAPRTVPAFVSIAASTAVAVFVLCAVALTSAQAVRYYVWSGPVGSVVLNAWGATEDMPTPALLKDNGADRIIPLATSPEPSMDDDGNMVGADVAYLSYWAPDMDGWMPGMGQNITVVSPDDVELLTGITLTPSQRASFSAGGAIAVQPVSGERKGGVPFFHDGRAQISLWAPSAMIADDPHPLRSVEIPVDVHVGNASAYPVILSPAAASRNGLTTVTNSWVGVFTDPASDAQLDRMRADAETASTDGASLDVREESGPDSPLPWLVLVFGILSAIVIAASAISLGLARIERREDDATLAAVGATARLRRRVSAWQAVIIAGIGCLIGVGLGLVGTWALVQAAPDTQFSDVPYLWLIGIGIGLPLAIALVSLLIRPPRPDLTHRTAIA